jgi:predicted nucleic acid-binding protein
MPLLALETATRQVEAIVADDAAMTVWWATELECVSAIARHEREGSATRRTAERALHRLDQFRTGWDEIEPHEAIRRTARRLLRVHPLRAADSLQLAAAIAASEGDPSSLQFVCLDVRLAEAAKREGFVVVPS